MLVGYLTKLQTVAYIDYIYTIKNTAVNRENLKSFSPSLAYEGQFEMTPGFPSFTQDFLASSGETTYEPFHS